MKGRPLITFFHISKLVSTIERKIHAHVSLAIRNGYVPLKTNLRIPKPVCRYFRPKLVFFHCFYGFKSANSQTSITKTTNSEGRRYPPFCSKSIFFEVSPICPRPASHLIVFLWLFWLLINRVKCQNRDQCWMSESYQSVVLTPLLYRSRVPYLDVYSWTSNTVKLGYNELGYNEHLVITNKFCGPNGHFAS